METRWFRRLGPGVAALGAMAAIASTTTGAPPPIWDPPDCGAPPAARDRAIGAWLRLDPTLDRGTLVGQRLTLGRADRGTSWRIDLDAESFAAVPLGGTVLVGSDDGRASRLSFLDLGDECRWPIGSSRDVVRGAIPTPDGTAIIEHRVDRRTRADLGIWRRPLDGGGATPVLGPIGADRRYGPTWITQLGWSEDGASLVVTSCGEVACRHRVVPAAGGTSVTIAEPALGSLVGMADDRLVVREACRGLPCSVVSYDLAGGDPVLLAPTAGLAVMARDASGRSVVVHEVDDGLRAVALDGRDARSLPASPHGLRLVTDLAWSASAAEHAADLLVFGPDGRVPLDGPRSAVVRALDTDAVSPSGEVLR